MEEIREECARRVNGLYQHYRLVVWEKHWVLQRLIGDQFVLVPPISMRMSIAQEAHESNGHLAAARLQSILKPLYWWPSLAADCV